MESEVKGHALAHNGTNRQCTPKAFTGVDVCGHGPLPPFHHALEPRRVGGGSTAASEALVIEQNLQAEPSTSHR